MLPSVTGDGLKLFGMSSNVVHPWDKDFRTLNVILILLDSLKLIFHFKVTFL